MGLCLQKKDAIFDYLASNNIGKPTGNDLREGKISLPLIYALNSNHPQVSEMRELITQSGLNDEEIEHLYDFAKQFGGIEYAKNQMTQYANKARTYLKELPSTPAKTALEVLLDYVINRDF